MSELCGHYPLQTLTRLKLYSAQSRMPDPDSFDTKELLMEAFSLWSRQLALQSPKRTGSFFLCNREGGWLSAVTLSAAGVDAGDCTELAEQAVRSAIACKQAAQSECGAGFVSVLPIVDEADELLGLLGCHASGGLTRQDAQADLEAAGVAFITVVDVVSLKNFCGDRPRLASGEAVKREKLFQAARNLHAMIDVDSVLTELFARANDLFPGAEVNLLLSQDRPNMTLPVKLLRFASSADNLCSRSFMDGSVIVGGSPEGTEVAAPLIGKQGAYGVLHMIRLERPFGKDELDMLRTIAESAGTAFENAKLYEQSNLLIHELRLINEITKRLNESLKLNDIFSFACSELIKIFGADFCCILERDRRKNEMIVKASNLPAMFHENFEMDYGFSGVVYSTKEPLIISDYWTSPKVKSKLMEITGSRSLIASPIIVNSEVVGVILVTHRFPNFFTYDNFKLLQVLSDHIGLAISNASLHAEVRRMVITDMLTGLYARHYLDEQIGFYQKRDYCGSLIVVDIDNFKGVNDTFGHQIGDKILVQVSQIIKTCIRESDIAARWGGEELAIYLPQVSIEQAMRIGERIRNQVLHETDPPVTVSCGIADWAWEDERISVETLFYRSDMALYRAKHDGKNQIKVG